MSCRTSPRGSARSCATNIFWDTAGVTNHATRGGARSKSSCTPPRECRLSASPRKQFATGTASKFSWLQVLRPRLDCASFALLQKISVVTWFASTREANTANKIFKAGIRAKRVEAWTKQNARVKSLFVALFEPIHGLIPVTESRVDHRNL